MQSPAKAHLQQLLAQKTHFCLFHIYNRNHLGELQIDQMVAVIYRRDGNVVSEPRAAVSFGRRLHPQTESALLRKSGIDPAITGRPGIDE
jgi:hypothetical protein